MFKGVSILKFRDTFKKVDDCKKYLYEKKWSVAYSCKKCASKKWYKGRDQWHRKCALCYYDESATSGTLFHKMKVNLLIAFEIAFSLSVRKKGMSSCEIAKTYELQQKTAWLLRQKIQSGMKSSGKHLLKGEVHVDEIVSGGKEKGKPGRNNDSKKMKLIIGCEIVRARKGKRTLGNAYAQLIEGYKSDDFRPFFESCISKDEAKVKTDKWTGYSPLKKDYQIEQILSEKGSNFPEIHILIMLFKGWLRGIHHKSSKNNM